MSKKIIKTNDEHVCRNLRELRLHYKMSQQKVADYLQIHRSTYCKYETGSAEPSFYILRKLVELFDTDFNLIFNSKKAD